MDGTMFSHHSRLRSMKSTLSNVSSFGAVKRVVCGFSFMGDEQFQEKNIRCDANLEPLGAMGDLGWYCIRFALWVFNWELPVAVYATARKRNDGKVPIDCIARLEFSNDRVAFFDCSFINAFRQTAEVSSDRSVMRLDDFVIARSAESCFYEVVNNPGLSKTHCSVVGDAARVEVKNCCQEAEMWADFSKLVSIPEARPSSYWPKICYLTQVVLDACMQRYAMWWCILFHI